jgi:hypothetical protein
MSTSSKVSNFHARGHGTLYPWKMTVCRERGGTGHIRRMWGSGYKERGRRGHTLPRRVDTIEFFGLVNRES